MVLFPPSRVLRALAEHVVARRASDAHIDLVMRRVTVEVEGKAIMRDGKFLI
jgi:hypothetical protein